MKKWEYKCVRITLPSGYEGKDLEDWTSDRLSRYGDDGWEVCTIREDPQSWLLVLKRERT
jgi:hypothetical protein